MSNQHYWHCLGLAAAAMLAEIWGLQPLANFWYLIALVLGIRWAVKS